MGQFISGSAVKLTCHLGVNYGRGIYYKGIKRHSELLSTGWGLVCSGVIFSGQHKVETANYRFTEA